MAAKPETTEPIDEFVVVNGRTFRVDHIYLDGPDKPPYYGCGILPLRRRREDIIRDIQLSQGPEWRQQP